MDGNILHAIDRQIRETPGATAIEGAREHVTYEALGARIAFIAAALTAAKVAKGDIVALVGGRSASTIAAIFAVMRLGAIYLPIAPGTPPDRLRFMLEDSGAKAVLITKDTARLPEGIALSPTAIIAIAEVDKGGSFPAASDAPLPRIASGPGDVAYAIYTSGSTGRPKGALIEHEGLVNRIAWMRDHYGVSSADAILQKTPFIFDVSIWEIFLPFTCGARMILLPDDAERFPPALIATIERFGVTLCHFIPSLLGAFLHYLGDDEATRQLGSLRRVFCSGEALTAQQVALFAEKLYARNGTALTNFYGPTEATVDVTYFDCPLGEAIDRVPIGRPVSRTSLRIMDVDTLGKPDKGADLAGASDAADVAAGGEGELWIGGIQVARGYLNRPELTADRFVMLGGERYYRSGDLARFLPDGNVEYLGRIDTQIKIRGMRIELGEIEHAIVEQGGAIDCVVLLEKKSLAIEFLVAYLVPKERFDKDALLLALKARLPDYMIPKKISILEAFPRLDSGKVDRRKLIELGDSAAP